MAMLAEKRIKTRYSRDPRNTAWANDTNKFGERMLKQMGWSRGKGLGANEDGNTEHVKLDMKDDNRGVGCTNIHDDNWIAHQDDFNAILTQLNESHGIKKSKKKKKTKKDNETDLTQSLEQKSKKSRSRVHYHKFTKGKDLTGASQDDLACILGNRNAMSAPATPLTRSEVNSDVESVVSCPEEKTEQFLVSSTSVQDYFASKMKQLQQARAAAQGRICATAQAANPINDESSDDGLGRNAFGFGFSQAPVDDGIPREAGASLHQTLLSSLAQNMESSANVDSKKKRKRNKLDEDSGDKRTEVMHTDVNSVGDESNMPTKKMKKKKKKHKCVSEASSKCSTEETPTSDLPNKKRKKKAKLDRVKEKNQQFNKDLDISSTETKQLKRKKSKKSK
ncbi:PREDICTED: PIN2/TERF1-interacting telomerase inhibitor 1-like [Priapulus caudatus]|uniref:PIN2/TERF1-interacting telomerase inhibitor 1-like n=1 Tax=Priapulus caudatus TaxID=37621 RepID=A0ABM1DPT0_PRICU|nr:PREDICTED: PIN2/TERF1-interacting telomerase inhibitor 1-like [Priapulus caudatus]